MWASSLRATRTCAPAGSCARRCRIFAWALGWSRLRAGCFKVRIEDDQVKPQPVLHAGSLGNELLAVVVQQTNLHRRLVEERSGESLDAFPEDRAGDGESVDRIGLPGLPLSFAALSGDPRRDPDDVLSGGDQRLLKAPGHVRQSSIAHTTGSPSSLPNRSASRCPASVAWIVRSARFRPISASTAT